MREYRFWISKMMHMFLTEIIKIGSNQILVRESTTIEFFYKNIRIKLRKNFKSNFRVTNFYLKNLKKNFKGFTLKK
jgi:hypothetical protein